MAQIYSHTPGKWRASVSIPDPMKKNRRMTKVFDSEAAAETWAKKQELLIRRGVSVETLSMTFGDALTRYANEVVPVRKPKQRAQVASPVTIDKAQKRLYRIARYPIGQIQLRDLTANDLMDYRDCRLLEHVALKGQTSRMVSPGAVRREMGEIGSVLTYCVQRWRLLAISPMRGVKPPDANPPRTTAPTMDQVAAFVEALGFIEGREPESTPQWAGLFLALTDELGTRAHELWGMPKDQPLFESHGCLMVADQSKTGTRKLRLTDRAARLWRLLLRASAKQSPDGQLWPHVYATYFYHFRKQSRRLGLDYLTVHDFRAGTVTRIGSTPGWTPLQLAAFMGHGVAMLGRYFRADAADFPPLPPATRQGALGAA
ncbi:MAG: tyrosine-type recombinase/integrase [Polynucleobacter sp.]